MNSVHDKEIVFGREMTINEICKTYGVSKDQVRHMIHNYGYSFQEIVERLEYLDTFGTWYRGGQLYEVHGMLLSIREMCDFLGVSYSTFRRYTLTKRVHQSKAFDYFYAVKRGKISTRLSEEEKAIRNRERAKRYYESHKAQAIERSLKSYYRHADERKAYNREYSKAYYRRKKAEKAT